LLTNKENKETYKKLKLVSKKVLSIYEELNRGFKEKLSKAQKDTIVKIEKSKKNLGDDFKDTDSYHNLNQHANYQTNDNQRNHADLITIKEPKEQSNEKVNLDRLIARRKELESIEQITSQILVLSNDMKNTINRQGSTLC
jgi:hypothetical protein